MLDPAAVALALAAFLIFCALSGAVYLVNDVSDREADRQHPLKSRRPIASGALSVGAALVLRPRVLSAAALAAAFWLRPRVRLGGRSVPGAAGRRIPAG